MRSRCFRAASGGDETRIAAEGFSTIPIEMEGSDIRASATAQCEGTNTRGERCGKRAVRGRFCLVHAGAQDMAALGHAGGKASVRSRLGLDPELANGRLRKKAKARLEAMLDSDDERTVLTAARSLYSYSPTRAPSDEDDPPAADTVSALKVILPGSMH
jgi:hypothetical protein